MSPADKKRLAEEQARSKAIEAKLGAEDKEDQLVSKLLLLGAGESGKSTLFKQMIQIYGNGFSKTEREGYIVIIYNNVITSMQTLLQAAPEFGGKIDCQDSAQIVRGLRGNETIDSALAAHFKALWSDKGIQQCYVNRSKFQLTDSAAYFFERLDQVAADDFLPEKDDIVRCRVRTTGIVENDFTIEGNVFKMFDVGGQRNERKKWIHCFENVTAVLFVGVLSEYDLLLYEDGTTNRMVETLTLFEEILSSRWFTETAIILFLNKKDLFQEKITEVDEHGNLRHPLTACPVFAPEKGFSDDINNYETGCKVIEEAFLDKNPNPDNQMYPHITCATDTGNVSHVFEAVKDIIIRRTLQISGLG